MKNIQTKDNTEYSGLQELLDVEAMSNYNDFIVTEALKKNDSVKKVIDFGAGIGTLSMIFRNKFFIDTLCVEIDEKNKEFLSERNLKYFSSLNEVNEDVDLIFSSNVLEHIEDDVAVLREMTGKLSENGKVYLYLPAKMFLWSQLDEEVGHYRRYEINELKDKCQRVGLKIEALHYADCIGFFASLSMKLLGYDNEKGLGSLGSLKFYDKWIFPVSKFFDKFGLKHFFGKNIILTASKK